MSAAMLDSLVERGSKIMRQIQVINKGGVRSSLLRRQRFTDDARSVLEEASERWLDRDKLGLVPSWMVLWAAIRREPKLGLAILQQCGLDIRSLERELEGLFDSVQPSENWVLDLNLISNLAQCALAEARGLGVDYVGTEHLILALLRDDEQDGRRLLEKRGLNYQAYKQALLRFWHDIRDK